MLRYVFSLFLFLVCLVGIGLWFGEMRHLRQAVTQPLPPWSDAIAKDARIPEGLTQVALAGIPFVTLRWQDLSFGPGGLRWQLKLIGPGLDVASAFRLPYLPREGYLEAGTGTVQFDGETFEIERIDGVIPLRDGAEPGVIGLTFVDGTTLSPSLVELLEQMGQVNGTQVLIPLSR